GNVTAEHNLGVLYTQNSGGLHNFKEAAKWFRKAAERGYVDSQLNLGGLYANGQGVPRDYVQAYLWLNLAAVHSDTAASTRDVIAAKMSPQQIAQAKKLTREWQPQKPKP